MKTSIMIAIGASLLICLLAFVVLRRGTKQRGDGFAASGYEKQSMDEVQEQSREAPSRNNRLRMNSTGPQNTGNILATGPEIAEQRTEPLTNGLRLGAVRTVPEFEARQAELKRLASGLVKGWGYDAVLQHCGQPTAVWAQRRKGGSAANGRNSINTTVEEAKARGTPAHFIYSPDVTRITTSFGVMYEMLCLKFDESGFLVSWEWAAPNID